MCLVYFIDYDLSVVAVPEGGIKMIHDLLRWVNPFLNYFVLFIPLVVLGYFMYLRLFSRHLTGATWKVLLLSIVIQGLQMISAIIILKSMGTELAGRQDVLRVFVFIV